MIKFKELLEKSGAGDWGTDELTKTLSKETPGQSITDMGLKNKERALDEDSSDRMQTFTIMVRKGGPGGRDYVTKVSGKDREDAVKQWRKRNPKFKNDTIDVKQLATLKRKGDRYSFSEGAVSVSTVEKEIRNNGGSKIRKTDRSMEFMHKGSAHTIPLDRGFVRDTDYMKLQKYLGN